MTCHGLNKVQSKTEFMSSLKACLRPAVETEVPVFPLEVYPTVVFVQEFDCEDVCFVVMHSVFPCCSGGHSSAISRTKYFISN